MKVCERHYREEGAAEQYASVAYLGLSNIYIYVYDQTSTRAYFHGNVQPFHGKIKSRALNKSLRWDFSI